MTLSIRPGGDSRWGLLANRNFMLLWCAYGISAMGDHLSEMAILKTQDALNPDVDLTPLTARMTFMFFVPFFVLAPTAGLLADRLPRRALMITADVVRCAIMLCFAGLIVFTQDFGPWGPFFPLLALGAFAAVFSPARTALLPTLIRTDQLVAANGMIAGLGIIGTMAAGLAGGYLANRYEPMVAFRLDALTYLTSAALLCFMRVGKGPASDEPVSGPPQRAGGIVAGLRYARMHPRTLELLAIGALVWFCGALVVSAIPAVVRDVYLGTYLTISAYRALLGLGFIIGAVIVSTLGDALRSEIAITWGLFGIALGIAVFASSTFFQFEPDTLGLIGAVGLVGAGIFGVAVMASYVSLLQRIVADKYRGRIFGVRDLVCTAATLTATGVLGVPQSTRIDRLAGTILVVVALVTFTAGAVTFRVRARRRGQYIPLTAIQNLNEFFAKFWWRFKRVGPSTVPREGPVIVTANHTCPADPNLLSAAVMYRPISFMVAVEYTHWPIIRWFMHLLDCIPVKREIHDTGATKQAIRHLRAGKAVGIFIEGRTVRPGETAEPKHGVAMLALRTGAKVVPAHISGITYRVGILRGVLTRHRARVRFGPPVDLTEFEAEKPSRETLRAASERIFAAIYDLAPPGDPAPPHGAGSQPEASAEQTHAPM